MIDSAHNRQTGLQPTTPGDASKQSWQNVGKFLAPGVPLPSMSGESSPVLFALMCATLDAISSTLLHSVFGQHISGHSTVSNKTAKH